MRQRNAGFTLVELMFVVGIIAILASTALPAYQAYVVRARVSEAFGAADVGRHAVAEYYARWGRMPKDNSEAGLFAPEAYRGRAVRGIEVRDGVVRVTLSIQGAEKPFAIYVRPAIPPEGTVSSLAWACNETALAGLKVLGTIGSDVLPKNYLPGSCR